MQTRFFLGQNPFGFHRVAYTAWGRISFRVPVVCVHGLTRNGRDFDPLAAALQNTRRIFCPDIVGRGKSDWLKDPTGYGYPQYLADMNALIARTGRLKVDWVGTSMGGIIGMFLASLPRSPIRRLVINDVGPFIPLAALQRIASYVGQVKNFADTGEVERHMRQIYAGFGALTDAQWQHLAAHGTRATQDNSLALAHDPAIAQNFAALEQDVDFWPRYDRIRCPVLLIRGERSDILTADTAQAMTERGPKAKLLTLPAIGHAPALMDAAQIKAVTDFLAG